MDWRAVALCWTAGIDFSDHGQAEAAVAVCGRCPGLPAAGLRP